MRAWLLVLDASDRLKRSMPGASVYDFMYRVGLARLFWSGVDRPEIRDLVEGGPCAPERLAPATGGRPRAIDLGCGAGGVSIYLAQRGFDTTGVDFSGSALDLARRAKERATLVGDLRFVQADLTAATIPGVVGPFDLLVDYGALDDLSTDQRRRAAVLITSLARQGSRFFVFAFYGRRAELPLFSLSGPSRFASEVIEPDELEQLFRPSWDIESLPRRGGRFIATFLLTRR